MGLPISVMKKLLNESGATRVSESAQFALKTALERKAQKVALKAIAFSTHATRKTVKKKDVDLALELNSH